MNLSLSGKVALVTGASKGIGLGIARSLAELGAHVVLLARGKHSLDAAVASIQQAGFSATGIVCDVTHGDSVTAAVETIVARHNAIHILVNNAGGVDAFSPFDALTDDDFLAAFEANVFSLVKVTRAVLPHMRRAGWGRIINIASESGLQPDPFMPHYNAAKAAVLNLSKSMSKAFAPDGILVNTVSPAFVMTPLVEELMRAESVKRGVGLKEAERQFLAEVRPHIELKRAGRVEEVGAAVAFLASDAASFITGVNLRVDGGSVATL